MSDKKGPKSDPEIGRKGGDGETNPVHNTETDFFNKHYNKELRVAKDEIPIVLAELNESAIAFIKKDQYERALNLLQKAYGIMDAIDFTQCRRDMYHLFIMFHNMALCYQKMQLLEECAQCIEHAFEHLPTNLINLEEKSISYRMRKIYIIGKLKLQYCAILSQIHRHKDALEQAREGVRVCHQMVNDMHQLCQFYVKREKLNVAYKDMIEKQQTQNANDSHNTNQQAFDEYQSRFENKRGYGSGAGRNRSFSSFLSQQEAYSGFDSLSLNNIKNQSFHGAGAPSSGQAGKTLGGRQASVGSKGNYSQMNQSGVNISMHSLSSFCTVNELEKSMSYVERTAKKLLPILQEVKKRMIPDKKKGDRGGDGKMVRRGGSKKGVNESDFDEDDDLIVDLTKVKGGKNLKGKNQPFDMKNILGYLNQGENLQTLSIGNIMQLQAFKLKDLIEEGKNELELTRESFILKISHLAVSYFCYSTEIRFILQMKEDPTFDATEKQKESEFWHAKSLEVACSFLPGECPLLNHINMSFQKHFAPVKTVIKEDEAEDDNLTVVKPMHGIENQKFHPIIKNMEDIDIAITPYQMTPLNAVTKPFINQLKSFNEYTESQKSRDHSFNQNSSLLKNKKQGTSLRMLKDGANRLSGEEAHLEGISEDGPNDSPGVIGHDADSDLQQLEMLFKRVQMQHGVDKMRLFKKLIGGAPGSGKDGKNNNILHNVGQKHQLSDMQGSRHEDTSIDRHLNTAGGVDFLMDENILTNESREEEDEASISQPVRTPSNQTGVNGQHINNLNVVKSINQINNASFTNQPGLKKLKASTSSKAATAGNKLVTGASGNNASRNNQIPASSTQFSHGQSAGSSFHQRPKTQINQQRNSSQRGNEGKPGASNQNVSIHSTSDMNASSKPATKPSSSSTQMNQRYHQTAGSGSSKLQQVATTQQLIESKSKRTSQRPFSGGIQKMIKSDNHKSRVQNFTQKNFSMYEQKISSMEGQMRAGAPPLQLQTQQAPPSSNPQQLSQKFVGQGISTGSPQKLGGSGNGRNIGQLNAMSASNEGIGNHNQLYFNGNNQQVLAGSGKNYVSSSQNQQVVGSGGRRSEQPSSQLDPQKQMAMQRQQQQQIQQMSGSSKGMNQLQGAASNILASNGATGSQSATNASLQQEQTQYEDLKKKLLHEYKKMKKSSGSSQPGSSSQQQAQQMQPFLNPKNQQQQIEQTLQNSAKVMSQSHQHMQDGNNGAASNGATSNLNNSTASAHLNVYKPTFIINNSYQPGQPEGSSNGVPSIDLTTSTGSAPRGSSSQNYKMVTGVNNGNPSSAQINNPQNLQIQSAGPAASEKRASGSGQDLSRQHQQQMHAAMSKSGGSQGGMHSSFGKKGSHQGRSGTGGATSSGLTLQNHGVQKVGKSSTSTITPNQQQMLLMNVLMSQGMDRAQAQAQVAQQMSQMSHSSAKPHKTEGRAGSGSLIGQHQSAKMKSGAATSSGNRYAGSSSGPARGVTPTTDAQKIIFSQPAQYVNRGSETRQEMYVQRGGSNELSQFQQQHLANKQNLKDYDRQKQNTSQASHHTQSINSLNSQFSAANLPQASSIVTGGKMLGNSSSGTGPSGTRGSQYLQSSHSTHGLQGPSRKK